MQKKAEAPRERVFDAVLYGWSIFRLRQQGWDDATIR